MSNDSLLTGLIAQAQTKELPWWTPIFWTFIVFLVIVAFLSLAKKGASEMVPRNWFTRVAEHVYLFIENMVTGVIGPHGKKYIPLVFTLYLTVLVSNLFGLLGLFAPTSVLGVTFGMALMVVFYVQQQGIKTHGVVGYIKHFMGPNLGMPWYFGIFITVLLFGIEVVSELAKNLSLSLRLQGNIHGEHMVGQTLGSLVKLGNFNVPIHALLLPLGVFVSLVQALVFTMLTCVYLAALTQPHEDEAHAH